MSDRYIYRLEHIRDERNAAQVALAYLSQFWNRADVSDFVHRQSFPVTLLNMAAADDNLDDTFFVRLTAEFEGILKDHLRTNHQIIQPPVKIDDLVSAPVSFDQALTRYSLFVAKLRNPLK